MIRWWRRRRARKAEASRLAAETAAPMLPFVRAMAGAGDFRVPVKLGGLVRPAEFGPLLQPLEVVERVRTAIFRDQMKALAGRFAQRAEDWQNEFVERWGEHWSHDYVSWLTA